MTAKKTVAKPTATVTKKQPKAKAKPATKKKLSALDAAAQVLAESGGSMTTKELIEVMAAKNLWESPNGKTPAATLYAAILRELNTKGKDSRFKRTEPGKFAATGAAARNDATEETKPASAKKAAKSKATKGSKKKATEPTTSEVACLAGALDTNEAPAA